VHDVNNLAGGIIAGFVRVRGKCGTVAPRLAAVGGGNGSRGERRGALFELVTEGCLDKSPRDRSVGAGEGGSARFSFTQRAPRIKGSPTVPPLSPITTNNNKQLYVIMLRYKNISTLRFGSVLVCAHANIKPCVSMQND
jgi:hypothetical protein